MTNWMQQDSLDEFAKHLEDGELSITSSNTCHGYGDVPSSYFIDYPSSEKLPYASGTMFLTSSSVLSKVFDCMSYNLFTEKPYTYEQRVVVFPHAAERLFSMETDLSGIAWV